MGSDRRISPRNGWMSHISSSDSSKVEVRVRRSKGKKIDASALPTSAKVNLNRSADSTKPVTTLSASEPSVCPESGVPLRNRVKKSKKAALRKRFSFSNSDKEREKILAQTNFARISIGDNVSFSHKEHVGENDANQFLVRMIRVREERYADVHQQIQSGIHFGYVHIRPPAHKKDEFAKILPAKETKKSSRSRKKGPMEVAKYHKFWIELLPQVVPPKQTSDGSSWNAIAESLIAPAKEHEGKKRWEELQYFPENLSNALRPSSSIKPIPRDTQLAKGPPDYVLHLFHSDTARHPSQLLGVIPLTNVKITPINNVEFTISYVNRLPVTHTFKIPTIEEALGWFSTLELATGTEMVQPVKKKRSSLVTRTASLTHSLQMFRQRSESSPASMGDVGLHNFYHPICWDIDELKHDACGGFSEYFTAQEMYSNESDEFDGLLRQGWRALGGTFSDLIYWCLLTSDRPNSDNIDFTGLLYEYTHEEIRKELNAVWVKLKDSFCAPAPQPKSSKRKTGSKFFGRSSLHSGEYSTQITPEQIAALVNLERKLYNLLRQWIRILSGPVGIEDAELSGLLESIFGFCTQHLGKERCEELYCLHKSVAQPDLPLESPRPDQSIVLPTSLTSIRSALLAEQLTIIEFEYYQQLRVSEFLKLRWDTDPKRARGIKQLTDHYNEMGLWVATEVLLCPTPKGQAKVISRFIRVARKLFEMRNYASCAQILSGVSHRAVQRLKRMNKLLDWKTMETYEKLNDYFDPVSGYANYRNKLSHEFPSIPFLVVYLRTLTLIEEGNPKTLDQQGKQINLSRMVMTAESIDSLHLGNAKAMAYNLEPVDSVQLFLRQVKNLQEDKLFQLSEQWEPLRGNLAGKKRANVVQLDFDEDGNIIYPHDKENEEEPAE